MRHSTSLPALAAALSLFIAAPAFAVGSGSTSEEVEKCKKGEVWDKKKKECVKAEKSSMNDADLIDNGKALAYAGRYGEAIAVLKMVSNQQQPEVLNFLGYSTRNNGDLEGGLAYYRAALTLDPDYTLARSYMGQALVLAGDRRGAMEQLYEIEKRRGADSYEYKELAKALLGKSLNTRATY